MIQTDRNGKPVWRSQNGRVTLITEMADSHLRNAIAKIQREENWRTEYLLLLKLEESRRRTQHEVNTVQEIALLEELEEKERHQPREL